MLIDAVCADTFILNAPALWPIGTLLSPQLLSSRPPSRAVRRIGPGSCSFTQLSNTNLPTFNLAILQDLKCLPRDLTVHRDVSHFIQDIDLADELAG